MKKTRGNRSLKFVLINEDMGGWVRISVKELPANSDELGFYLSVALSDWFREHPEFRLRFAVPIQRDGNTVELHGWYDVHVFLPVPSAPRAEKE